MDLATDVDVEAREEEEDGHDGGMKADNIAGLALRDGATAGDDGGDDDEDADRDSDGGDDDDDGGNGDAGDSGDGGADGDSSGAVEEQAQLSRHSEPGVPEEIQDSRESRSPAESQTLAESRELGPSQTAEESRSHMRRSHRRADSLNLEEEWQDEDFPSPILLSPELQAAYETQENVKPPVPPSTLALVPSSSPPHPSRRKLLPAPDISLSPERGDDTDDEEDEADDEGDTPDIDVDALETPDDAESLDPAGPPGELEWEDDTPLQRRPGDGGPHGDGGGGWRTVIVGDAERRIDMRVVEPYKRVLSHGGYYGDGLNAIIVFAACYLPDGKDPEYAHIMENLFLYMVSTLDRLVAEDYMIVYLNGATPRRRTPGLGWLKRCYTMIDRRLRKNLKTLLIVHPSLFVRTLLALTRPFISSKFSRKIRYVHSLAELAEAIPMEHVSIPDCIQQEELDMQKRRHESDNTPWYT